MNGILFLSAFICNPTEKLCKQQTQQG